MIILPLCASSLSFFHLPVIGICGLPPMVQEAF